MNSLGLIIEALVAVLLLLTIIYCVRLNAQIKRLKADETIFKATISELMTATGLAERAIAGLKLTVRECDEGLGERLRMAERFCLDMDRQLETGKSLLNRLSRIVAAGQQPHDAAPESGAADTKAIVAAAQAFADRARARVNGIAA